MTHLVQQRNHSGLLRWRFAMGTTEIALCVFLGHFFTVQSVINEGDAPLPQTSPGFFDNAMPFPFESNFRFPPFDTMFSSWRSRRPGFHMLAGLPPLMNIPRVKVSCDESSLTLLVAKRANGVTLTADEMQLGDGCRSNRELPNHFVFTYRLDECGTIRGVQNGAAMFTNSLHLILKRPPNTWWQNPTTVHVSCIPRRFYANPNTLNPPVLPRNSRTFDIKAMDASWTSITPSNVYKRGQIVNLQVFAKARPEQQLFIQSCFVSSSPEPETRPRHAVIMNKGCTAPLGSSHAVVRYVPSNRVDVINFELNTSYLLSEVYVHCSVLLSDQGITSGSKSCNYNLMQSRWEDLSGSVEVCECCSSKCRGLSVKYAPEDAKAIVSTGPLVIVDKEEASTPEPPISEPRETSGTSETSLTAPDLMLSDAAATEQTIVSDASMSRGKFSSAPQAVVVVSQKPAARLTLWLPGQIQHEDGKSIGSQSEEGFTAQFQEANKESNDIPEEQLSTADQQSYWNAPSNKNEDQNVKVLTLLDWIIPPRQDKNAIPEDPKVKLWFGGFGLSDSEVPQKKDFLLPEEMIVDVLKQDEFSQLSDEPAQRWSDTAKLDQEGTNPVRPVIRSKLQFSKGMDGTQTLSYEEEVTRQQGDGMVASNGMDVIGRKVMSRQKPMFSTFLDLIRMMDKSE